MSFGKVEGLIVGGLYRVAVISDRDPESELFHRQDLDVVRPSLGEALSLGDVRVRLVDPPRTTRQ